LCKFEGFLFGDFWVKNGILKRWTLEVLGIENSMLKVFYLRI
jgi:hypothetical protein